MIIAWCILYTLGGLQNDNSNGGALFTGACQRTIDTIRQSDT